MAQSSGPNNIQLIITRPRGQAASLIEALQGALIPGLQLSHLPLIEIEPLDFEPPDAAGYQGAIFISRNASINFFDRADLSGVPLYAVGSHSAEQIFHLTQQAANYPQQMNAEGLLAMPELQSVKQQRWLLVKGAGGRDLIERTLAERGATVDQLAVYRRRLPDYATQQAIYQAESTHPVWLVTSGDALRHLHRILGLPEKPRHGVKLIVSSERIAKLAHSLDFDIVAQAGGASEQQLVECIKQLYLSRD